MGVHIHAYGYTAMLAHPDTPPCTWVDGANCDLPATWAEGAPQGLSSPSRSHQAHTHCGDSCVPGRPTLPSGAPACARQEGPCQRKIQTDYTMLEATAGPSRWTRLGGDGGGRHPPPIAITQRWTQVSLFPGKRMVVFQLTLAL